MSASTLRDSQLQMARYLRNPEQAPAPAVEERRLKIYRELIFNNVEGFISGGFPVLRSLYCEDDWGGLVRSFMDVHRCQSPYFLEISQEFIHYLSEEHSMRDCDPPFITELAHYEWVELALDVAEQELPARQAHADPAQTIVSLSPLAWVLAYQYPVHMIGPGFQPAASGEPTYLVVYRDRADEVRFMELNAASARLLELHRDNTGQTADSVVVQLAGEMGAEVESIRGFALEQLQLFLDKSILV